MADIAQPLDFLGVNYYSRSVISASEPWDTKKGGLEITDMGWEVYPEGLTELLVRSELSDEQAGWARSAARSGRALLTIVNDVLDLSKVEATGFSPANALDQLRDYCRP